MIIIYSEIKNSNVFMLLATIDGEPRFSVRFSVGRFQDTESVDVDL